MVVMDNRNPYQAPPSIATDAAAPRMRESESVLGIEFESDWSIEGIRYRRRSDWHGPADVGFLLLTATWILLIVVAAMNLYDSAGMLCLLTPIWILAGVLWISNLIFRHAGTFTKSCRGLSGPIRGQVDAGYIRIAGPAMCFAARTQDCTQSSWTPRGAAFRPPLITELLPVIESDIRKTWTTHSYSSASEHGHPEELLNRLLEFSDSQADGDRVIVGGLLRGTDLRGQGCWWIWQIAGVSLTAIGLSGLCWGGYQFWNLPPWVLHPPRHYIPSDADTNALGVIIVVCAVSAALLCAGVWKWTRTVATIGKFQVAWTPGMIAISNEKVAIGYYGDALWHFTWTERGIAVRDPSRRVTFMIPARWFDDADRAKVASWLTSRSVERSASNKPSTLNREYYVGPKV